MLLIADSGSTKTDWRLVDSQKNIYQFGTIGFNPYFQDSDSIASELRVSLRPNIDRLGLEGVDTDHLHIYFYGAGCSTPDKCRQVETALKEIFPFAQIEVQHDLLAASRALCGNHKGIVAILGTGSNSCYYDGYMVAENVPSLGFILGDEGSGAHIGKQFITDYLNKEMPWSLADDLYETYKLKRETILDVIYRKPMPNRFLASFSRFIHQHKEEPYVVRLISSSFNQFFNKHICKYPLHKDVKMHCVGSVAYYYSDILKAVADEKGVKIDKIIEAPISGLMLYHLSNNPVSIQ
jgi:glucosamine kinase